MAHLARSGMLGDGFSDQACRGHAITLAHHSMWCATYCVCSPNHLKTTIPCCWQTWEQEFAWTEADKPLKLAAKALTVPHDSKLSQAPIFCFETMMHMLYWTCLVYDYKRVCSPTLYNIAQHSRSMGWAIMLALASTIICYLVPSYYAYLPLSHSC